MAKNARYLTNPKTGVKAEITDAGALVVDGEEVGAGGAAAAEFETPTGSVDGSNAAFTFTDAPQIVLRNGANETHLGYIDGNTFNFDTPPGVGETILGCVTPGPAVNGSHVHIGGQGHFSVGTASGGDLKVNSGGTLDLAAIDEVNLTVGESYVQVSEDFIDIDPGVDGSAHIGTNTEVEVVVDSAGRQIRLSGVANSEAILNTAKVFILGLPTADPSAAGQLWVDAGVLKVSAG